MSEALQLPEPGACRSQEKNKSLNGQKMSVFDLTNPSFIGYITLHSKQPPNKGYNMLIQSIIAIMADRHNLTTTEIMEMMDWIEDHLMDVNELYNPADYTETFESFQRQESNQALATEFLEGRAVGYSEVHYNAETGEEVSVDDTYGILDFLADCAF